MTTEPKPYTVADLRAWANDFRAMAETHGRMPSTKWNKKMVTESRAQAAAFDALADGIEKAESLVNDDRWDPAIRQTAQNIGRILQGEKP